jgi:hypothetical protein
MDFNNRNARQPLRNNKSPDHPMTGQQPKAQPKKQITALEYDEARETLDSKSHFIVQLISLDLKLCLRCPRF